MIKSPTTFTHNVPVWVIIAIYISIFINSYIFFQEPFEFYLGYLIYIVLLPGFIAKFGLNRNLTFVFLILILSGVLNIILGNDTPQQFVKVIVGLTLSYFFYDYVIKEFQFDLEQLFKWYMKGAFIVAVIGMIQFVSFQIGFRPGYMFNYIFNKWGFAPGGNFGIRINSVMAEPTHLGAVLSAAFFVSLYNLLLRKKYAVGTWQSLVIVVVYVLSFSGLGQIGIFLTLIFLAINFGLLRYILVVIPVGLFIFNVIYTNSKDFRDRYDSLIVLFTTGKFELGKTHGSSFILYNNYVVALENFKANFVFGTGVGSHPVAFEKYSLAKNIKVYGFNLNSADANSMFLRLVSETGLFGTLLFFTIIIKFYVRRDPEYETFHWLISNAILVMILLNLFRQGHYFLNGFPFFVLLYIYNSVAYKELIEQKELDEQQAIAE